MVEIHDITNTIFMSKTYILSQSGYDKAWIVDIGDVEPVFSYLQEKGLVVEGLFLTHAHFDHIYGLEALDAQYPGCKVYCTEYSKEALASDKLNMSKYHGTPIIYEKENVFLVHEGDRMALFKDEPLMVFYETPGHNPGCLTMVFGNMVFSGDAYIPGVRVNTKLPKANREQANESLLRIIKLAKGRIVLSGHEINQEINSFLR